jgi:ribosome-associated protein
VASTTVGLGRRTADKSGSLQIALLAAQIAAENEGRDIVVLDLRKQTAWFDYFVIVTGRSGRQLRAISDEIDHALIERMSEQRLRTEGYKDSRWIVLDFGNVLVHVFDDKTRDFYQLEDLWADSPRVDLPDFGKQSE